MSQCEIKPISQPKYISVIDESTQKAAVLHVDSIAAMYTESQEQHTNDGPILLGVRFLFKSRQESFFYIDEKKYVSLLAVFNPEAIGEKFYVDTSEFMSNLKKD